MVRLGSLSEWGQAGASGVSVTINPNTGVSSEFIIRDR